MCADSNFSVVSYLSMMIENEMMALAVLDVDGRVAQKWSRPKKAFMEEERVNQYFKCSV